MITKAQQWKAQRKTNKFSPTEPFLVLEELIAEAGLQDFRCPTNRGLVQRAVQKGTPFPERCLPGALILKLDPQKRKILGGLRGEMTNIAEGWVRYHGRCL